MPSLEAARHSRTDRLAVTIALQHLGADYAFDAIDHVGAMLRIFLEDMCATDQQVDNVLVDPSVSSAM